MVMKLISTNLISIKTQNNLDNTQFHQPEIKNSKVTNKPFLSQACSMKSKKGIKYKTSMKKS
jgi:hypothetical protein